MQRKRSSDDPLNEDVRNADRMGLSYGYYKLYQRMHGLENPILPRGKKNRPLKTQNDIKIFEMWKSGSTDTDIANILGVTRQSITSWRNHRSLPCQREIEIQKIDTTEYGLIEDESGKFFIFRRKT